MKPERDPGKNDDEEGRNVHMDDVIAKTAREVELAGKSGVITCISNTRRLQCCFFVDYYIQYTNAEFELQFTNVNNSKATESSSLYLQV